jgi:hypothetical protein
VTLAESYREIAERSGVHRRTVHAHREHWRAYVRRVKVADRWNAHSRSVWHLGVYSNVLHLATIPEGNPPGITRSGGLLQHALHTDPARDLFHRWTVGWSLHNALSTSGEPVTAPELVRALEVHRSTVSRGLRRLEANGMAERRGNGWVALHPQEAEDWHYLNERRKRHSAERDVFDRQSIVERWRRQREGQQERAEAEDQEPVSEHLLVLPEEGRHRRSPGGDSLAKADAVAVPAVRGALQGGISLRRSSGGSDKAG